MFHKDYIPLVLSLFLDCGPCLALGCPLYIPRPFLAPLQSIRFSSSLLANISLLTYARFIASIHLGTQVRRKTFCGCMRYGFVGHFYSSGTYRHIFLQYVLAVLVSIQLSVFFLVNAMALWVDQLLHGVIKELSLHTDMYDGTFLTTTLVGHDQILLLGCH